MPKSDKIKNIILLVAILGTLTFGLMPTSRAFIENSSKAIIQKTDPAFFKSLLNSSFGLIDLVYNSGTQSLSASNAAKVMVKAIFGIDLEHPVTLLSAQLPAFNAYYNSMENRLYAEGLPIPNGKLPEAESSTSTDDESETRDFEGNDIISKGKLVIQNETKYKVNVDELRNEPLKIKFNKSGPKVLIYHTHTTEGYITNMSQLNRTDLPSRTSDEGKNVVRVGEALAQDLRNKFGIGTIHNGTVHTYPSDTGAYKRSLDTAEKIMKSYPSIRLAVDLHRDGMSDTQKLRTVVKAGNKAAARIMFVVGTDSASLRHSEWRENLKLAIKLQDKLEELCPGITKPIYISKNRYNQHLSNGAMLVEIGGDGNLLTEALESTKYLAEAINYVCK